ncbi:MAG TPA: MFS transporter [Acidimicrobiales bacterium]|nr:MFS transporter [Acidimicrobiales bacterium]
MTSTFRSLRVRNYRLFAGGQLVSLTGSWMQRTGQDWLVLRLSHSSGSAAGITMGLQFLPILLFGLQAGVVASRFPKRRVLLATQSSMALTALALALLTATGAVTLHEVYLLALVLGCATAFDNPARQAFVSEMVGPDEIANAVGLNSATFNGARLVGPALAGLMIETVGTAPVFFVNVASFAAVIAGLLAMRESELVRVVPLERARGQVREGIAYVRERKDLVAAMALMGIVGMLGLNFQITLALVDKTVFHRGAAGYGLLSSLLAVGSLVGALSGARGRRPTPRLLAGLTFAFGVSELTAGLMPSYLTLCILLLPTGYASMALLTAANSAVQLGSEPAIRARVMSLYVIVLAGTTPIGAPLVGWVSEVGGARWGLLTGGIASSLAAIAYAAARAGARRRTGRTSEVPGPEPLARPDSDRATIAPVRAPRPA